MTVPLVAPVQPWEFGPTFGTDNATDTFVSSNFGNSSTQLGSLGSNQTATIELGIFHEGTVTNWTATPVWTNSP